MSENQDILKHPRVLFVGAFPPADRSVFGGNITDCKILLGSSLPSKVDFTLLDSTQISNPPPALPKKLLLAIRRVFHYLVLFERSRPDVVLLFCSAGASFIEKSLMAWYARIRRVQSIMFPRGGALMDACYRSAFTRRWVRVAFGGTRKILCQGPAWQNFAVDLLDFSVENAPIIENWTATPELLSIGRQRSPRPDDFPVSLLFVGWLEQNKGIFELLQACRRLAESRQFILNVVGEGHASQRARELVHQTGLEDIVHFHGWLKGKDLEDAYANAEVFVLPSWAEGFPNSMVEGMSAGLAVVVTSVGNIPDLITNEKEALIIAPRDSRALQSALARVIDDRSLRAQLGKAAFNLAGSRWKVEEAADKFLTAINSVITRKHLS